MFDLVYVYIPKDEYLFFPTGIDFCTPLAGSESCVNLLSVV